MDASSQFRFSAILPFLRKIPINTSHRHNADSLRKKAAGVRDGHSYVFVEKQHQTPKTLERMDRAAKCMMVNHSFIYSYIAKEPERMEA